MFSSDQRNYLHRYLKYRKYSKYNFVKILKTIHEKFKKKHVIFSNLNGNQNEGVKIPAVYKY